MRDAGSVAVGLARWRGAFLASFAVLFLVKWMLAASLSPFGDEAFYWQESRHLAWGYSDLPPLTALLIRLGEMVAGHGVLGMRWPFLLIGSTLPWLVRAFAREQFGERVGWQAGLLCLALPLAGSLGVLALPDVPLTTAIMLAVLATSRAMTSHRLKDWLLLGAALAVCWLTHYRAALPMLAGLLLMTVTPRGRQLWRLSGFWLAMGVAALGTVPLLVSNWQQHGAGIVFQVMDRNDWGFHLDAIVQPLEQALACTPLLYGLLWWAAWRSARRCGDATAAWDLIAVVSLTMLMGYFLLGLFADDLRFRVHWPLPGYLPLLAALPALLRERLVWRKTWLVMAFALAVVGQLGGLLYLGLAASEGGASVLAGAKAFPARFVGWRESGAVTRKLLDIHPGVVVADNFLLAAELDFQLDGRVPVYSLDHPINVKHGRAPQLAIWQRDEAWLRRLHGGEPMLLVVDEKAINERDRAHWLQTLCGRIDQPQALQRLSLYGGRIRFAFYQGQVPSAPFAEPAPVESCVLWRQAYAADMAPR